MRNFNEGIRVEKSITFLYFAIALIEVVAEFFSFNHVLIFVKPLVIIVLMGLYWSSSNQKKNFFFMVFSFMILAKILVIFDGEKIFFCAMMAFLLHRITMFYFITRLIELKDYIPLLIVMIPFLFFFLYLLSLATNISTRSYYALIVHSIMTAVLASITVSHYFMNNEKSGLWLLIYGLMSVMQFFIVFIDKFYLEDFSPVVFKPLPIILTNLACYAFYRFVIETERFSNN